MTLANGHVKGSPFKYSVTSPRATPYTGLSAQNCFKTKNCPYDVAVTEEGYLAVAERGYHIVTLYSTTGQTIHTFGTAGSYGSANGRFSSPSVNKTITGSRSSALAKGLSSPSLAAVEVGKNSFPLLVASALTRRGRFLYQIIYSSNCVQVFNEDDSFAYSFPCQQNPWGMARDIFILLLMAHTASMSSLQRELCSLAMALELSTLLQALPLMLKATLPSVSMVEAASGSTVLITLMFTHSLDSSAMV